MEYAHKIDQKNGNDFQRNLIAFKILDEKDKVLHGWSKVTGHLLFDIKMRFTRKDQWELDDRKMISPIRTTKACTLNRESMKMLFAYATLNMLDLFHHYLYLKFSID